MDSRGRKKKCFPIFFRTDTAVKTSFPSPQVYEDDDNKSPRNGVHLSWTKTSQPKVHKLYSNFPI